MFNFKKLQNLAKADLAGDILEVSNAIEVAPVMIIRHLLKLEGLSKRAVKEIIEGTVPPPEYLKESLEIALRNDPVFSPKGIQYSKRRGKIGEDLIAEWLDSQALEYTRDIGQGGPDLLLKNPIRLDIAGKLKEFDWIESKASYCDAFELKRNRAQFRRYNELGRGLIFYWFGIERNLRIDWDVFTWKDLYKLVEPSLKEKIKGLISFIPLEFRFLISRD